MKPKQIGAFVVLGGGLGLLWWFSKKGLITVAAQPVTNTPPPTAPTPTTPMQSQPSGPSTGQVVGAVASTVGTVAGIVAGSAAPVAVAAVTPAIAAVPATGVVSAAVGGSTTAGSVAAAQAGAVAANASTPAGTAVAGSGGISGMAVGLTLGIGAAFVAGYFIWRANRNDTKEDREDFVESLKSITVNGVTYELRNDQTGTQFDHLHAAMLAVDPVVGEQLWIEATQQIGKKDRTRNVAWMHKVLRLFGLESQPAVTAGLPYEQPFSDEEEPEKFDDELLSMEL